MIVVDSAVVAYFVIPGANTAMSELVRAKDPNWHAPALLRHELISVVTMHVRQSILSRDDGVRAYRRALSLVELNESLLDPVRILNLHFASNCTSYDCQFAALAEDMGVPLITTDKEVLQAFPGLTVHPDSF